MESRFLGKKHAQLGITRDEDGRATLRGYFAVFNKLSRALPGGFVERVAPRAFDTTLATSGQDIISTVSHQLHKTLGRVSAGNLRIGVDEFGARYEVDLLDTTHARDLAVDVEAGIVLGSSFMFTVAGDGESRGVEWSTTEAGQPLRTLTDIRLFEVGPTSMPAYPDTERALVPAVRCLAAARNLAEDEVMRAARSGQLAAIIDRREAAAPPSQVSGAPCSSRIAVLRRGIEQRLLELPAR